MSTCPFMTPLFIIVTIHSPTCLSAHLRPHYSSTIHSSNHLVYLSIYNPIIHQHNHSSTYCLSVYLRPITHPRIIRRTTFICLSIYDPIHQHNHSSTHLFICPRSSSYFVSQASIHSCVIHRLRETGQGARVVCRGWPVIWAPNAASEGEDSWCTRIQRRRKGRKAEETRPILREGKRRCNASIVMHALCVPTRSSEWSKAQGIFDICSHHE